jgi:hypothetical protein
MLVALQEVIKEYCSSAPAQTQIAPPEPTIWDHNGSVMYLVAQWLIPGCLLSKAPSRNLARWRRVAFPGRSNDDSTPLPTVAPQIQIP